MEIQDIAHREDKVLRLVHRYEESDWRRPRRLPQFYLTTGQDGVAQVFSIFCEALINCL